MIRYTLRCDEGHEFESWFRSSEAYDKAAERGALACAVCGSETVERALMAPAVAGTKKDKVSLAAPDPRSAAMRELVREFRKKVTENSDYVGDKFAEEARRIHYQETETRGIYGEATPDEARDLAEEGIAFAPLPRLPDEAN